MLFYKHRIKVEYNAKYFGNSEADSAYQSYPVHSKLFRLVSKYAKIYGNAARGIS